MLRFKFSPSAQYPSVFACCITPVSSNVKPKIERISIGPPTDFRHLAHLGYSDVEKNFDSSIICENQLAQCGSSILPTAAHLRLVDLSEALAAHRKYTVRDEPVSNPFDHPSFSTTSPTLPPERGSFSLTPIDYEPKICPSLLPNPKSFSSSGGDVELALPPPVKPPRRHSGQHRGGHRRSLLAGSPLPPPPPPPPILVFDDSGVVL